MRYIRCGLFSKELAAAAAASSEEFPHPIDSLEFPPEFPKNFSRKSNSEVLLYAFFASAGMNIGSCSIARSIGSRCAVLDWRRQVIVRSAAGGLDAFLSDVVSRAAAVSGESSRRRVDLEIVS